MKVVLDVEFHLLCKRAIVGLLLAGTTAMASTSINRIIESVKAMERTLGVAITTRFDLSSSVRHAQQVAYHYGLYGPAISPDGTAIAWSLYPVPYRGEEIPFLTVQSLKEGIQPVRLEKRIAVGIGVSSGAEVIVAIALPPDSPDSRRMELLAIDRRSGVVVHDLTPFVTKFGITTDVISGSNLESISVSGPGTRVALGTPKEVQVLEIPSGKTVYAGPGRFPRVSPDGKRLAFVDQDKLWMHSLVDGSTLQLLKGKRVMGAGGWSPDGRFLLVGAWTTMLAFEKRQIIVDTTTGEYAVIGKLGEGDYGSNFAWVSTKLLTR